MDMYLAIAIFFSIVGFCAGSMRSLETSEVKRLTQLFWETNKELDEAKEEYKLLKRELTSVKLEHKKLLKQTSEMRENTHD